MSSAWQRIPTPLEAKPWYWRRESGAGYTEVVKWDNHLERWTAQRRIGKIDCISGMATTAEKAKELLG